MKRIIFTIAALSAGLGVGELAAQETATCPKAIPAEAQCWSGRDENGSYYWIARPRDWNGVLVVHSHGGPRTPPPKPESEIEDLDRFAIIVKRGFALAATSYREGGYLGVAAAADDSENLRRIYIAKFGKPRRTIAHGQSWGGGVTAHAIERPDAAKAYDGAMLTSGLVAGNIRGYDYRADLRAVYQFYCRNHPRPDEPQYPVWMGLPRDASMTHADLEKRVDECTGVKSPPEKRTALQKRNLANILGVIHIAEKSLIGNMSWSTLLFQDIVRRLDWRNPFTNEGVRYAGSDDDEALNKGVARFTADPEAARRFIADGRLTGRLPVPVLTMHAIDDPTVFVEQDAWYRRLVDEAGSSDKLVQTWTRESEHSYLSSPEYAAILEALMEWIEKGTKPTARTVASLCEKHAREYDGGCHFDVDYRPRPLETREYPR
jgi:alpha-beta hydrolase superfamily lysophospholipase